MIPQEGPHRRIRSPGGVGHTVGFDPLGRGHTIEFDPAGGATTGISFEIEYLSEFEFIFDTALGYESGGWRTNFAATIRMQSIS